MKKIIFKTFHFPDVSETFITNQVVAAIDMGYDVAIIVKKKKDIQESSQSALIKKYDLLAKTFEITDLRPKNWLKVYLKAFRLVGNGYPAKYLRAFNFFKYNKAAGLSGRLFYDLVSIHSFLDADIFHVQFGVYAEPLVRLKKYGLLHGKIITTFHGFDAHFTNHSFQEIKNKYKDLFTFGSKFTYNTPYLADQLKRLKCPTSKLEIVPMGIDTNYFKPLPEKKETNKIKLISVGRLIKWKGHAYGIKVIAELVKKGFKVKYTIVGEGKEQKNLEQLIKNLNLENNVVLIGAKDQQFIRNTMQQSDLFLMTSTHDDKGRRETQGVVTGEAQACGLPVCAFKSGGVPYTMVDGVTGFLSEEDDYMDMAANVEKLITHVELRKKMSANARQFVTEHYSLGNSTAKLQKIYQKLLNSN